MTGSEKPFVIVIPSYNNAKWYERNLNSAVSQNYSNYRVIYIDDLSTDSTGDLVQKYITDHQVENKVKLVRNEKRVGAMENLYREIHGCKDEEIAVLCDGDDNFLHSDVLKKLDRVYQDPNIWVAWSNYLDSNGNPGCSKKIPENVIKNNSYRHHQWSTSHVRTFYAKYFKLIKREDFLQKDGHFYRMAWDLSIMIPLVEMAAWRSCFIDEYFYHYNTKNPISDDKINRALQEQTEREIRAKNKYLPL